MGIILDLVFPRGDGYDHYYELDNSDVGHFSGCGVGYLDGGGYGDGYLYSAGDGCGYDYGYKSGDGDGEGEGYGFRGDGQG
jgi:hypothetical protein